MQQPEFGQPNAPQDALTAEKALQKALMDEGVPLGKPRNRAERRRQEKAAKAAARRHRRATARTEHPPQREWCESHGRHHTASWCNNHQRYELDHDS